MVGTENQNRSSVSICTKIGLELPHQMVSDRYETIIEIDILSKINLNKLCY